MLKLGQIWISESDPHESFKIYGGELKDCESDIEVNYNKSFDDQHESNKIFFWERLDIYSFSKFVDEKITNSVDNSYTYSWSGCSDEEDLVSRIIEFNMKLSNEPCKFIDPII